jgi:hypothetical protein
MTIGFGCCWDYWDHEVTYGTISEMSTLDPHPAHAGLFKLNSTSVQCSPFNKQGPVENASGSLYHLPIAWRINAHQSVGN